MLNCPISKIYESPECKGNKCAWFNVNEYQCAILLLSERKEG